MRHRRTPEPGTHTPADDGSRNPRDIPYVVPPWAAKHAANDNGRDAYSHHGAMPEGWEDEATTVYRRSHVDPRRATHTPRSAAPAPRPSPRAASQAEPHFGIEGQLQRSIRPETAARGSRLWQTLPGLLLLSVCTLLGVRALRSNAPLGDWGALAPVGSDSAQAIAASRPPAPPPSAASPVAEPAADRGIGSAAAPRQPEDDGEQIAPEVAVGDATLAAIPEETFTLAEVDALAPASPAVPKRRAQTIRPARRHAKLSRVIEPLRVAADSDETERVAPARKAEGILQLNSRPWARVIVDGRFVGHTPQLGLRLSAGKHHVQLLNEPMDMSKTFDVTVQAGKTVSRVELLEEN